MNFDSILEKLKQNQGFTKNKEVQDFLGFRSESGFYFMRNGKGALKEEVVAKIMKGTGLPAPVIVGAWEAENGKNEEVRKSWGEWLRNGVAIAAITGAFTNNADSRA